jgi:glycosyltransferase involved in cell wall biosynthesis
MNICIVSHNFVIGTGQGRVNYEVVKAALARGYQITLIATEIAADLQSNPQVTWLPITVSGFPTELLRNLLFSQRSSAWLRRHAANFDLIQINGAICDFPADVNAAHFVHSSWLQSSAHTFQFRKDLYGLYQWLYTYLNAQWERAAFARSGHAIAVSAKVKQELVNIGILPDQVHVIVNGVDVNQFSTTMAGHRITYGLPEQVPLALFAGELRSARKNLETVLQALCHVPSLHLAVAGDDRGTAYRQQAITLGIADRVHFLGQRSDLPQLMQLADLFVFPSRYEACTLVLLEAMASGLPVITARSTGGCELVTPECGVVLADSDDAVALGDAIQQLLQTPHQLQQMGQAARQQACQYNWPQQASQYLDLFEVIVQRKQQFTPCDRRPTLLPL